MDKRKLSTSGALWIALALLLPVAVHAASTEHKPSASKSLFKPGHYVGVTSQRCTAAVAAEGSCKAGKKLPISFTLTKHKISHIRAVVIETCEDQPSPLVYTMNYKRGTPVNATRKGTIFYARNSIGRRSVSLTNDLVAGSVKRTSARGVLESLLTVNANGQLDPDGEIYCYAHRVHWRATRRHGHR